MKKGLVLRVDAGFTIIELLITIAISGLLISFGSSAYRKSANRQALHSDSETFIATMQTAKKQAVIGEKDCTGPLSGIRIGLTVNQKSITKQAICQDNDGDLETISFAVSAPNSTTSFIFRPLTGATDISPAGLDITLVAPDNLTSQFTISQSGAISHVTP